MRAHLKGLALAALLLVSMPGCSTSQAQRTTTSSAAPAEVDATIGSIRLSLDRYELTSSERGIFSTANDLAMSRCMGKAGYPEFFPFVDRRNPTPTPDRRYGIWVRTSVARYGYQPPPPTTRAKRLAALNALEMTPAADKAYQACIPQVHQLGLKLPGPAEGPVDRSALDSSTVSHDSPQWKAVRERWISCMRERRVPTPSGDDWVADGMMDAPVEVQIRVGLVDVACKAEHHVVQQLADLDAQAQQPYIEKHEAALVAQRRELDALVARSRQYIVGAAELPPS